MKHAKTLMLAAAGILAAAALTGCGSNATKVGILQFGTFDALDNARAGFEEVVKASGLNVEITVMNPQCDSAQNDTMANTLAGSCDLLYGIATPSAKACKSASLAAGRGTPVIFSAVTDPVSAGLVEKMEQPGGFVTGCSDLGPIEASINLYKEFTGIDKVALLYTGTETNSIYQANIAKECIEKNGWSSVIKTVSEPSEIAAAVASIADDVDALWIPTDDSIAANIAQVKTGNNQRQEHPLIVMSADVGMIEGSVLAMGVDYKELGRRAGAQAVEVLKGKDAGKIDVVHLEEGILSVNKTWADQLGIAIPQSILNTTGATII